MARVVFPARYLIEAAPFVSTEATRYYLTGVCVRMRQGKLTLTATDGHRLVMFQPPEYAVSGDLTGEHIVSLDRRRLVLAACAQAQRHFSGLKASVNWAVLDTEDRGRLDFVEWPAGNVEVLAAEAPRKYVIASFSDVLVDGTFPDTDRVVPSSFAPGCHSTFNTRYLADFLKLCPRGVAALGIYSGSTDPAHMPHLVRVPGREDVFGIIMPMRGGTVGALPPWFSGPAPTPGPEAQAAPAAAA